MTALALGIVIGFLMCIPVGPINVWVVNTLIKHNFRSAFSIALGGALMDFTYFMVILSGLSFFRFSPTTVLILKIVGVLFLLIFGIKEIFYRPLALNEQEKALKKIPHSSSFFLMGVLIYTSNPTLIATMTGLAAMIKSWGLFHEGLFNHTLLSLGLAGGSTLWFFILLKGVMKYQSRIPEKFFTLFARSSGVFIVLFSLYMAINVYKELSL